MQISDVLNAAKRAEAAGDEDAAFKLTQYARKLQMLYVPDEEVRPPAPVQAKPKEETGLMGSLSRGIESMVSSAKTAAGAAFGDANVAAEEGLQRGAELEERLPSRVGLDRVSDAYNKDGVLAAAKEVATQAPHMLAENAPSMGAAASGAWAGAKLGSTIGTLGGPVGKLVGGVAGGALGAFAPSYVQMLGGMEQRQAQEQKEAGLPVNVDVSKAALAAVPAAGLDTIATFVPLGGKFVSKLTGIPVERLLGQNSAQVAKLAEERLAATLLKGTGTGILAEVPTEVAQQMLERAQAGLSLTDADAMKEYGETAYQVSLLGPIGAAGRLNDRSSARDQVAREAEEVRQQESAAAKAAEEAAAAQEEAFKQTPEYAEQVIKDYQAAEEQKLELQSQLREVTKDSTEADKLFNKDIEEKLQQHQTVLEELAREHNRVSEMEFPSVEETVAEPAYGTTEIRDYLTDPVGRFTPDELGPEVTKWINTYRRTGNLPPLESYSVEDVKAAMTRVNPQGEQAALDSILTQRMGYKGDTKLTPEDIFAKAKEKNIAISNDGFESLLHRIGGTHDITEMSQPQLHAVFKVLEAAPAHEVEQVLPSHTNATQFSERQYTDAITRIKKETTGRQVTLPDAIAMSKQATMLRSEEDVLALLRKAREEGAIDIQPKDVYHLVNPKGERVTTVEDPELAQRIANSQNLKIEQGVNHVVSASQAPQGAAAPNVLPKIEVVSGDTVLHATTSQKAADAKAATFKKIRDGQAKVIAQQISDLQRRMEAGDRRIDAMEAMGKFGTPEHERAITTNEVNKKAIQSKIDDLQRRHEQLIAPIGFRVAKPKAPSSAGVEASKKAKVDSDLAEQEKALHAQLRKILDKFGAREVDLKVDRNLEDEGEYANKLIKVALNADNPVRVLRHETIHALKELGFFTAGQWKVLQHQADTVWIDKYLKQQYVEKGVSRFDAYKGRYGNDMEAIREEAIADAFGDFDANGAPKGMFANLLAKIKQFFEALSNSLRGAEFTTSSKIFTKVEQGDLRPVQVDTTTASSTKPSIRNQWKATPAELVKAEKYEEENGILPYTSAGPIDFPVRYSIKTVNPKKPYGVHPLSGVPLNKDGTMTVYFHTTKEMALQISRTKVIPSEGRDRIYVTNESNGAETLRNRGNFDHEFNGSTVLLNVNPDFLQMDQKFDNGRVDFYIPTGHGKAFAKKMNLQSIQKSRHEAITDEFNYKDHEDRISKAVAQYKAITNKKDRAAFAKKARNLLKSEHNVSTLMTENGKLEKTRTNDYTDLLDIDKGVASMGLGLASAQKITDKSNTCARSAICEGLCLGETSGGNFMFGGAAMEDVGDIEKSAFRAAARMMQYLKTEALIMHPEEFAIVLQHEIELFSEWATAETERKKVDGKMVRAPKEIFQPAFRLNVTSDFKPEMWRGIIEGNPDAMFYDYTKLGSESIAPNHHLTYSSTGFGQIVNGEKVFFKNKKGDYDHNWATMRRRLNDGQNVAMAFSSKSAMPKFLHDEETGVTYAVLNGDDYDARFIDDKSFLKAKQGGKGVIVGLKNKAGNLSEKTSTQKTGGFFVNYNPKTDGDTVTVPNQEQFKRKVFPIAKASLRTAPDTPEFKRWFGNSKVVDADGKPLVVYHGSPERDFHVFDLDKVNPNDPDGPYNGFWFSSDFENADSSGRYPWGRPNATNPQTRAFYISLKNPATRAQARSVAREIADTWRDTGAPTLQVATRLELERRGFDGVIHDPYVSPSKAEFERNGRVKLGKSKGELVASENGGVDYYEDGDFITGYMDFDNAVKQLGSGTFAVFRPEQIKSAAGNSGAFNPKNPDIRYSLRTAPSTVSEFKQAIAPVKNELYSHILDVTGSGPLDGGCITFAKSLKNVIGGDLVSLTRRDGSADHAVVSLDGKFYDIDGPLPPGKFIQRFNRLESADVTGFRSFRESDLPNATHFEDAELTEILSKALTGKASLRSAPKFYEDIPNDRWLQGKVDYAAKAPRSQFGVPKMQSVTGSFNRPVMVPVSIAKTVPGQNGEQQRVRKDDLAAIRKIMRETGKLPLTDSGKEYAPFVMIGYDGQPWVSEGNHRIMAAAAEGWDSIPIEVRYYDGGQRNAGIWSPESLQKMEDESTPDTGKKYSLKSNINPAAWNRIQATTTPRQVEGFMDRIINATSPKAFSYFRQKALNRYQTLGEYERHLAKLNGGIERLADSNAESAALMSDNSAAVAAAAMGLGSKGGIPVYRNGMTTVDTSTKGLLDIFLPLAKYNDPDVYRTYQYWAAVQRGSKYIINPATGKYKEELFTRDDIKHAADILQKFPEFKDIRNEWLTYNNGLVKYMQDTGLISAAAAKTFVEHADYFPFYRQLEEDETIGPRISNSIAGVPGIKTAKGGDAALADMLETVVRNTQSAINMGMKNTAALKAADLATQLGMAHRLPTPTAGVHHMTVLENGKKVSYYVDDPMFLDSVKSLNMPELPFMSLLSAPSNFLRNVVTKDPGFILANMMRDAVSAYVTSGANITPVTSTLSNFGKALFKRSPVYEALRNAGVFGGYEMSKGIEQSGKAFGDALRRKGGQKTKGDYAWGLWDQLEQATEASDAATRMAVYEDTLKRTGNEAEAIFRSMEVMNFGRKGSSALVRIATAAIPFLNARMQGLDIFFRSGIRPLYAKDATEYEKRICKSFMVRGLMLMSLSVMYAAQMAGDDDYERQEEETRDNNWIVHVPGMETPVKIPIPFEVGLLFKTLPERIYRYAFGNDTADDLMLAGRRAVMGTLAINPVPQAVLPIAENVVNYSAFTGREVVSGAMKDIAPEYQATGNTALWAQQLGKELGMSPIKLEHAYKGYTGTMGMYVSDLFDAMINEYSDIPKPDKRFEQTPVLKRFLADPEARGTISAYYRLKDEVDEVVRTVNLLKGQGGEELGQYWEKNQKLYAIRSYMSSLNQTMKSLSDRATLIRASDMSGEQKRDMLLEITKQQNELTNNIKAVAKMARSD
jgi:hypothetical protein